jgi:hypothetical protein
MPTLTIFVKKILFPGTNDLEFQEQLPQLFAGSGLYRAHHPRQTNSRLQKYRLTEKGKQALAKGV